MRGTSEQCSGVLVMQHYKLRQEAWCGVRHGDLLSCECCISFERCSDRKGDAPHMRSMGTSGRWPAFDVIWLTPVGVFTSNKVLLHLGLGCTSFQPT